MMLKCPKDVLTGSQFRTIGGMDSREMLGVGFLDKSGRRTDHVNYSPSHFSLVYVINGFGRYVLSSGKEYKLEPGSYFIRFPGLWHSTYLDPDKPWVECFLEFGDAMVKSLCDMRIVCPDLPVGFRGPDQLLVDKFIKFHLRLCSATEGQLKRLVAPVFSLLMDVVAPSDDPVNTTDEMLEQACDALSSNLSDRFSLPAFCADNGWGYESFRKKFRQRLGLSPSQFRIRCRMDAARQFLLSRKELSVAEISRKLGYCSPFEFSRQFHRSVGKSPSDFRREAGF